MVRALASHQSGLVSNPGISAIWVEFVVGCLPCCERLFSPGTPVFPSQHLQIPIFNMECTDMFQQVLKNS